MSEKKVKFELDGIDPTKPFFLAASVGNADGSIEELAGGAEGAFLTEQEAIGCLTDLNDSYPGMEGYVFRCVPIKKIWRGKVRVTAMKP